MAKTETMEIAGREFSAKSLSVGDVIDVLKEMENKTPDVLDYLFEDGINLTFFYRALGITRDDIDNLYPEEVGELMKMVGKANPSLFLDGKTVKISPCRAAEQLLRICFRLIPLGYHDIRTYGFEDFKFLLSEFKEK
jgi:hypothetical protein